MTLIGSFCPVTQCHGFSCGSTLIEQGRIGNIHARQVAHHRLEVKKAFQAALCYFCLVGSVLSIPPWVLKQFTLDYRRHDAVVIPHTNVGTENFITFSHLPERMDDFVLMQRGWKLEVVLQTYIGRNGCLRHCRQISLADVFQHGFDI